MWNISIGYLSCDEQRLSVKGEFKSIIDLFIAAVLINLLFCKLVLLDPIIRCHFLQITKSLSRKIIFALSEKSCALDIRKILNTSHSIFANVLK